MTAAKDQNTGRQGTNMIKKARLNMLRLYRHGKTKKEIAEIMNLPVHTVNAVLNRAGLRRSTT